MPTKDDRIRARAYELWEREARTHGSHERHWLEATRQIEAEMAGEKTMTQDSPSAKAQRKSVTAKAPPKRPSAEKGGDPMVQAKSPRSVGGKIPKPA